MSKINPVSGIGQNGQIGDQFEKESGYNGIVEIKGSTGTNT